MGQHASVPRPGTRLEVVGAGLSRTGTASFSRALEILLDGPVYHGGTQSTLGPDIEIKSWIKVLSHWPAPDESTNKVNLDIIASRLDGYAATTDAPASGLVSELMQLYPDAKVICTVRDPKAWERSMEGISNAATMWFLRVVLFPLPTMRYFVDVLREAWIKLYGEREPPSRLTYDRHIAWLQRIVPKDRLVFFDVKDGWEPLCTALGKDIPYGVPFPRINDGEAIDRFAKNQVQLGLIRWAWIFVAGVGVVAIIIMML